MAFNPDEYLKDKVEKSGFDPDAYLNQKSPITAQDASEPSELQSLIEGGVESATAGLKPVLSGISQSAMDILTGITKPEDILERYKQYKESEKSKRKELEEANPKSFIAGQVVGSLVPALLTGGASEIPGAMEAAKLGAKYGAVQAFGSGEGDLTKGDIGQTLKDVLSGGALGAATGGVAHELLGELSSLNIPEKLEKFAAKRAVKATGGTTGEVKELVSKDRLLEHGKNLLKSSEFQEKPLVTAFSNPEVILERAQALKERSGQEIGNILNQLDEKIRSNPELRNVFFNPSVLSDELKNMQKEFMKNGVIRRSTEAQYNELQKLIDDVSQYGTSPVSFKDADEIKQLVTNLAYDDKGKLTNDLMGKVRGFVNDKIEESADKVAQASNDPDLYNKYINAKDIYRTSKDAERMSLGQSARNIKNKDLGITDYITGGVMAAAHGTPAGIVTTGFKKLVESYGNSLAAAGAKKTADVARSVNKAFTSTPEALKSTGSALIGSEDPLKVSLGHILMEASDKDQIGRNALIFSLMQNSKYRELMRDLVK